MDRNDSHQPDAGEPSGKLTPMHTQDGAVLQEGTVEPSIAYPPPVYPQDELTPMPPSEWMTKVPGDLEQLQRLVTTLSGTASNIGEQVGRLKKVNVGTFWSGDAAKAFTDYKEQLPPPLDLAQKRYQGTAHALRTYNTALHDIKQTARRAVQEATEAKHYIETHGHHVSEWRIYTNDGPVYNPLPQPISEPQPIAHPGTYTYPSGHPDGAQVLEAGTSPQSLQPVGVKPALPAVGQGPQPLPADLLAEFERFGASVKLMESAIDRYDDAAKKCAAAISTAIDDDLKNTAGYGKSLNTLKDKLSTNLAAIAPQLQGQLGRITGVSGLLGWLPMIAAFAGKNPQAKKTLAQLTKEAQQWKAANGDGKQIVDGFLKLLTTNTDNAGSSGHAAVGHGGTGSGGNTGSTTHAWTPPHTPDVWNIGQEHATKAIPGATAAEGTISPDTTAEATTPAGDSNFSFDAGGATVNVSITSPESMSQVATHTVPVPAGV